MPSRQQPSIPSKQQRVLPSRQQRIVQAIILALGAIIVFCFLFLDPIDRGITRYDRSHAVQRVDKATLVQLYPPHMDIYENGIPAQASIRFHNQIILTDAIYGFANLKEGDQVQLTYRIGRTGHIYVDRVESLPK